MAAAGSTTAGTNDPSVKTWTWTVESALAAGNASGALDLRGMESVEWFPSSITGYASGTFAVGLSHGAGGEGLLAEDAGRHKRSAYGATNLAGYCINPPPNARLYVTVLGTTPTAVTMVVVARAASNTPRNAT